jgi:hypothetical protein
MAKQPMEPALIDFHDAVILSVTLHGDSSVIIRFERLNCFYAAGPDEYEVWTCSASIACYGVQAFEVNGKLDSNTGASHGSILDPQQREVPALSADVLRISSMSLTLLSGTGIRLSMDSAKLDTVERVRQLERWVGPLSLPKT